MQQSDDAAVRARLELSASETPLTSSATAVPEAPVPDAERAYLDLLSSTAPLAPRASAINSTGSSSAEINSAASSPAASSPAASSPAASSPAASSPAVSSPAGSRSAESRSAESCSFGIDDAAAAAAYHALLASDAPLTPADLLPATVAVAARPVPMLAPKRTSHRPLPIALLGERGRHAVLAAALVAGVSVAGVGVASATPSRAASHPVRAKAQAVSQTAAPTNPPPTREKAQAATRTTTATTRAKAQAATATPTATTRAKAQAVTGTTAATNPTPTHAKTQAATQPTPTTDPTADTTVGQAGDAVANLVEQDPSYYDATEASPATPPTLSSAKAARKTRPVPKVPKVPAAPEAPEAPVITVNWVNPLPEASVTSCFGSRWGRLHAGVDLAAPEGTRIRAAGAGVIVTAGDEGGYGNAVLIDHGNGWLTHYGHMLAIAVKAGQHVKVGETIGQEGSTGHSTGPHLHFEVHQGTYQNPIEPTAWMQAHSVEIPGCVEDVTSTE